MSLKVADEKPLRGINWELCLSRRRDKHSALTELWSLVKPLSPAMLWITAVNEAILQFATAGLLLGATSVVSWSELYEFCLGRLEIGKDWENLMDFRNKNHTKSRNALTSDPGPPFIHPLLFASCKSQTSTILHFPLHHNKRLHMTSNPESSCFDKFFYTYIEPTWLFSFSPKETTTTTKRWWIHATMIGALIGIRLRKGQDEFTGFITWQRSSWMPSNEGKGRERHPWRFGDVISPCIERWDIRDIRGKIHIQTKILQHL